MLPHTSKLFKSGFVSFFFSRILPGLLVGLMVSVGRREVGFSNSASVGVSVTRRVIVDLGVLVTKVGVKVLKEFVAVVKGVGVRVGTGVLVGLKVLVG